MKKSILYTLISIILISSCHNYYRATSLTKSSAAVSVDSLKLNNRYFILRSGDAAYYMKEVALSNDRKTISCILDSLPADHQLHLKEGHHNHNLQYKKNRPEAQVLGEVHLYVPTSSLLVGPYTFSLDSVQKIEVIEKDNGRTTTSYILGGLGYTALGAVVIAAIIVATKSSCPFVSAYNNNQFYLQGEIYGGAIYPQLARHDYMPLNMSPAGDGTFQLKISNELKERQYTDMAELWVISHDKHSKVLADEKGNLYEIAAPFTPANAIFSDGKDVTTALATENDDRLLSFNDTSSVTNSVTLQFNKPLQQQKAKLVLSIKNSYWFDYLYGELAKHFGSFYTSYQKEQRKRPASELLNWAKEQQVPLELSVKQNGNWKKITDITTIGPLATREIVVPLDISAVTGSSVEIKLSSGFMFWEIDYAAIDYTENNTLVVQKLNPWVATDEEGKNILAVLNNEDEKYLEQPVPGNSATVIYKAAPQTNDKAYSYILHTKGYYEHVREFTGSPDLPFLEKFREPAALAAFSRSQFVKLNNSNMAQAFKN